jgi:hypothetical protein
MSRLSNFSDINETFIVEPIGAIPSLTACTGVYTDAIISCSGNTQIFMGSGIITFDGSIYTSDNITASTINASTFYSGGTNIIDIINDSVVSITGGTFNDTTDTLTLYNNKGNTINVTGFTDYYTTGTTLIGKTVYFDRNDMLSAYTLNLNSFSTTDTFSTGLTFSDNQIIIARNDGVNLSTFVNTFTGLTINGTLNVVDILANSISANTISATTFYGDGSNLTGISTQDTRIAEFTYSDNTFTITDSTGGTFNALFNAVTGLTVNGNLSVTGDTLLQSLTANTLFASAYYNLPLDIRTTGVTYDNNTFTYTNNTGETYSVLFDTVTGLTVNGILSATTISGETFYGDGSNLTGISTQDTFVTGGTYVDSTGVATFTNNTGGTFSVTGFGINVVNLVTVGLSGSTGVDYNSVKLAVDSITDASATNTYVVKVGPGVFYEDPIIMKSYVDVIGESETNTIIQANNPNTPLIIGADQSMISDAQIQGCTGTGVAAVVYSSATTPQLNAIFYVENVRFGANYTHAKTIGTGGGNCIMQCSNVKYGGYPFTLGFYVTNDGSGVGRMQLRNVTSTNGGVTTTTGLIFAKADKPGCAFIVNGCLLTKATGAAAGVGFWVEDGGSLRLTGVNFQRWTTGIYAPQTGSAPSIDAIALNFENCTTDVNIIHSGATGKIQGTDNYVKTLINIEAPLYEVNQDPRIISVAKKGGDFSSIKAAVDSITGSSINNRFLVSVGPGRFIEPLIDLTGKPYVSVKGSNIITTEVVPSTNTQHIFKIGQNNEVSFLSLSGAPTGYAGIYVYDIGDYAQAHKVSFNDCDTNVWVESNTQDTAFFGEYLDFNGSYSYGTKVIANNGYGASANMENYYNFPTGTGTTIANSVQGSGATLNVFVGDGVSNGVTGSTNYEVFDYGSLNTTTTTSDGWDYSVRNPNIGGPVRFDIDSISIVNSMTYDVSIEHPNTFGTFNGSASHVKINTISSDVYWAFLDIDDGEFDVTRKISVVFQDGTRTDASTLIFEGGTMGLIDGGVITHVSGLTFNISAGFGYLEKTVGFEIYARIDWPDTQITLSPNTENYLFFNENYILSSSGSLPDNVTNIILGRVVTDSTSLRFIDVTPYNASHTSNLLSTFNRNALGPIYSIGSIVTENATPYHLNISAGDYYYSENNFKPSGGTDVNFIQYYRDGVSGWITTGTTEVVNGYDDNSGFIAPLPLSSFTKHALYVVGEGINEEYMLVLGQAYYTSLVEAEGADLPTPPSYFDDGVTTIATILIQQGMSGITEIQDIRPVIGFKAAGVSASAVHGNLLGLTADDHKQYLLVDGVRAMTNNLSMGGNAIVSALTVNNVVVESHASRHKNGGADEIATATPAPSEIPKADTFGKLDGWISNASTSVKGLTSLSSSPVSATNPIAVGVTDSRFLSSISGISQSSNTLTLINNSGGTLSYTPNAATGGTYNNGTITLLGSGTLSTITGLSSLTPTTLYTGDGVLSGNRTLTLSGNNLSFVGSAHTNSFTSAGRLLLGTTTESTFLLDVSGTARVQGAITYRGDLIPANVPNQYCIGLLQGVGGSILRTYTNGGASPMQQFEFGFYNTSLNSSSGLSNLAHNNFSFRIYGTHIATGIGGGTYTDFRISPTYNFVGNTNPGTVYGINYEPVLTNITNTTIVAFRNTVGNNWFNSTGGNTLIGTTTDAGFKLDVSGTARVSGNFDAGSIGATTTSNRTTGQGVYLDNTANGGRLFGYNWATNTHRNLFIGLTESVITSFGTQTAPVRSEGVQFMTSAYSNSTMTFAGAFNSLTFVNNTGGFGYVSGTNSNYPSFESNAIGILSSNSASLPIYLAGSKLNIQIGNGTNSKVAEFTTSGNLLMQKGGTFTDVPSSIFTVTSTTQGVLFPRMTLTQRNAIASPAAGLQVIVTGETGGEFVSMYNSSAATWTTISVPTTTAGSVLFSNGTTIAQDNANFFWDNANKRLGISATVINNLLSVGYNVFNNSPLASIGFNPTSGNVASTNGYLSLINIVAADPTSGISTGAMLGFNSSATNFYGQGLGALRNSKFDIWFQTGAINGGGYRFYTGTQENVTIFDNGNMLLQSGGTKTNAGFRLDVNGNARVQGSLTSTGAFPSFIASSTSASANAGYQSIINNGTGNSATFLAYGNAVAFGLGNNAGFGSSSSIVVFGNSANASGGSTTIKLRPGGFDTSADALVAHQNTISIGTTNIANSSAVLDVVSTTKGILIPRMTLTQRNAIASPAAGLQVIVTGETGGEFVSMYNSSTAAWVAVGSGSQSNSAGNNLFNYYNFR